VGTGIGSRLPAALRRRIDSLRSGARQALDPGGLRAASRALVKEGKEDASPQDRSQGHFHEFESVLSSGKAGDSLINQTWPVRVRSFGPLNPDKVYYVIWRADRAGLFSVLQFVAAHLDVADRLGFVPIVDFQNFPSTYTEDHPIDGTLNSWEYYFEPVNRYSLDEVYESKAVVFCDGGFPASYPFAITESRRLQDAFHRHIRVKTSILEFADRFAEEHFSGSRVLGVHFRGQEMRTAPGHPLPATPRQMVARAQTLMAERRYEKVFLVTEEQSYLDFFRSVFGSRLVATDAFRTYETNAYNLGLGPDHKYQLGLDVLRDTLVLAKCNALLCGGSNVSVFAEFLNAGRYDVVSRIDNGMNSNDPRIARRLWFVRNRLPEPLGGFSRPDFDEGKPTASQVLDRDHT